PAPAAEPMPHQPNQAQAAPLVPTHQVPAPAQQHLMPGALAATPPQSLKGQRKGSGNLVAVVLTLFLVGGLVAAAIVYGRPYLFPDEWDETAKPYAESVENVRGAQFVEPVSITPEAPALYDTRASLQLTGDWEAELPLWRSLGLANGRVDQSTVDQLLDGWTRVLYSQSDGQIYHDGSLVGPSLDAHLTRAMAAAAIDQEFGWSTSQTLRSLDDAALVEAHVLQQSDFIQQASDFPAPIVDRDPAPLFFLPPVLGYQLVAPSMYAELLPSFDLETASANPLEGLTTGGPGPLASVPPVLANAAVVAEGDLIIEQPVAMDTSFWFLVLAGYLEAPQAWAASNAIVENSLAVVDRSGQACAVATFSGGDAAQVDTLRFALETWSVTAPAELGATTSVLPDGTIQFTSCDPGVGFENGSRLGAAHELIGYRLGEIATVVSFETAPPGEAAAAVAAYKVSGVGDGLAALPFNTTPVDAAAAARAAVGAPVLVPEPALLPEPTDG
ncbi:MAG: hypothetical protein ACR2O6_07905, partial [Ilumatobacteraceae bacterium]